MALLGFLGIDKKESLNKGLEKTKESVFHKLSRAVIGKAKVDSEVLDNLEEVLVSSDVGVATTLRIIERIEARVLKDKYLNTSELNTILKEEIVSLLEKNQADSETDFTSQLKNTPYIIMDRNGKEG
jgi:fused signal recognition particle receptor